MTIGVIFDIKRFALHDGRGLRSTLFLKGCPLSCPWCQNPEGIESTIQLRHFPSRCISCGECISSCPEDALSFGLGDRDIKIDRSLCLKCGTCIRQCPTNALQFDGRTISARDAVEELLRDRTFFEVSEGGVTLSGGEPLSQPEFAREVLALCKAEGVETAIETTLACTKHVLDGVMPLTDEFLVDLKLADETRHRATVGVENNRIHTNLRYLMERGARVTVRVPMIPEYTVDEENLRGIAAIVASLDPQPPVELINFNPLARDKYALLERTWPLGPSIQRYRHDAMNCFGEIVRGEGVRTVIV